MDRQKDEASASFESVSSPAWYVLVRGHHQGPYPTILLKQLLREGKIKKETLIWREGLTQWKHSSAFVEFSPVRPSQLISSPKIGTRARAQPRKNMATVFPLPVTTSSTPHHPTKSSGRSNSGGNSSFFARSLAIMITPKFTFLVALCWIVGIGYFFSGSVSYALMKAIRVGGPNVATFSSLFSLPQSPTKQAPKVVTTEKIKLRWSKEWHKLFLLVDGYKVNAPIRLVFTSVPERVLAPSEVSFYVDGKLKGGKAVFEEFHFIRGQYLAKGYYKLNLVSDQLKLKGSFRNIFYGGNASDFNEQLSRYQGFAKKQELKYHDELLERLSTLDSLVEHIERIFSDSVGKISRGSEISRFKEEYSGQVAMVMHGVTLDHKDSTYALRDEKDKFLLQEFNNLTHLGRRIGEDVADTVNLIEPLATINLQQKEQLIQQFQAKLESVRKTIQSSIKTIQNKI